jgi:Na+/H+ antiporter NhaD/arsenite permease-like protein
MTGDQTIIFAILLATVAMFLWGRWRHDMIAVAALIACVVTGLIPAPDAFAGFGHPAVVTVACVLVLSHALLHSGAVDALARRRHPRHRGGCRGLVERAGAARPQAGGVEETRA